MKTKFILITAFYLLFNTAFSQSVEVFAGDKRIGVDLLWFKNFQNKNEGKTPFLFISRNRASTDYQNSSTGFSSTNAVSFNFKSGIGIIGVASFLSTGFMSKLGIQYMRAKRNSMFFGWLVADLKNKAGIELFSVFRYQPALNKNLKIFTQIELYPVYNLSYKTINFTQRLRLGLKYHDSWTIGPMTDINQTGKNKLTQTYNFGGFLRHEF